MDDDFESGYFFEAADGTPILNTGRAIRLSIDYEEQNPFVTELTISAGGITSIRHTL